MARCIYLIHLWLILCDCQGRLRRQPVDLLVIFGSKPRPRNLQRRCHAPCKVFGCQRRFSRPPETKDDSHFAFDFT
ncbi:hypothetical protein EDB86DRAFT_2873912 [Lactarius hatsudake]|nr:hypothetical protein EDB86DRAFT_2873912 [Lactarius hatsudake]